MTLAMGTESRRKELFPVDIEEVESEDWSDSDELIKEESEKQEEEEREKQEIEKSVLWPKARRALKRLICKCVELGVRAVRVVKAISTQRRDGVPISLTPS